LAASVIQHGRPADQDPPGFTGLFNWLRYRVHDAITDIDNSYDGLLTDLATVYGYYAHATSSGISPRTPELPRAITGTA
jgi:hypothetical protein